MEIKIIQLWRIPTKRRRKRTADLEPEREAQHKAWDLPFAGCCPLALIFWLWPRLPVISRDQSSQADVCQGVGALLAAAGATLSSAGETIYRPQSTAEAGSAWPSVALGVGVPGWAPCFHQASLASRVFGWTQIRTLLEVCLPAQLPRTI